MRYNRLVSALAIASAIAFTGCNPDDGPVVNQNNLDQELTDALALAGGSEGMDFFKMPSSSDFSSIPQDPLNPITDEKVALGKLLFHETGLAVDSKLPEGEGTYSCASCHHAAAGFQAGMLQGIGEGGTGFGIAGEGRMLREMYDGDSIDVQPIRTPSAMNGAYQEVTLWNGQFGATGANGATDAYWTPGTPIEVNELGYEGLEIQAIAGLQVHRMAIAGTVCETNAEYQQLFAAAFPGVAQGDLFTKEYAGLAIAAYERTMLSNQSPYQKFLGGETNALTDAQKRGAILFFGKAECSSCHTGPALNTMAFYGLGMGDIRNHANVFQKKEGDHLGRGDFTKLEVDNYKFKVPQLYNLKDSPFFGHGGTFNSVREVIEYKNTAVAENTEVPSSQIASEFTPLGLSEEEIGELTDFVENGLYDPNLTRYVPSALPSGQCFPNNDPQSKLDLGCN